MKPGNSSSDSAPERTSKNSLRQEPSTVSTKSSWLAFPGEFCYTFHAGVTAPALRLGALLTPQGVIVGVWECEGSIGRQCSINHPCCQYMDGLY